MKALFLFPLLTLSTGVTISGQTCDEVMEYVKDEGIGLTYYSSSSDAISSVTFYDIYQDANSYYYAVVVFKGSFTEYIYQVGSQTKFNYSMNYHKSAGEAFWNYIEPYNEVLGCAPNFD